MSYPKDSKGRYLRIPIPLRRELKIRRDSQQPLELIQRHKRSITWFQKKTGVSDYWLLWLAFFEGIVLTLIIERLIAH